MRREFGWLKLDGEKEGFVGAGKGCLEWSVWEEIDGRVCALSG